MPKSREDLAGEAARGVPAVADDCSAKAADAGIGFGQTVLVLQGGGALGAYQAGVYQALHEAGMEPDWVIGTSIGAINAALIAGNAPSDRLARIGAFWDRVGHSPFAQWVAAVPWLGAAGANAVTMAGGVPGFFEPNPLAWLGMQASVGAEKASWYETGALRRTLSDLIDAERLNGNRPRLTVGAANVGTGQMRYFDSRDGALTISHVLASGALPPAFPAVRIDDELYWDGGVLSNTPVEAVFDDNPRRSGLVFAVHIWNPQGAEPDSLWKVMGRQKDIQYASRAVNHIARQSQLHRLRHVVSELAKRLPGDVRNEPDVKALTAYGCTTRMHVVRLLAPPLDGEDHSKDIDFSPASIRARRAAGHADTLRALRARPWAEPCDPTDGLILHEVAAGQLVGKRSPL
jgi:NTE family protein